MKQLTELAVVINPNSTRAAEVEHRLLEPLKDAGILLDIFETKTPDYDENAASIADHLRHTSALRTVVASGDGVSAQGFEGVVQSERSDLDIGFWASGGFCDFAHAFNGSRAVDPLIMVNRTVPTYALSPLGLDVNGERARKIIGYLTAGSTADAVLAFDDRSFAHRHPDMRQAKNIQLALSLAKAGLSFLGRMPSHNMYLPAFTIDDDDEVHHQVTDFAAINIANMARVVHNPQWNREDGMFTSELVNARNLAKLGVFAVRALRKDGFDNSRVDNRTLNFVEPSDVAVQTEGEYLQLRDVTSLSVVGTTISVPVVYPKGLQSAMTSDQV